MPTPILKPNVNAQTVLWSRSFICKCGPTLRTHTHTHTYLFHLSHTMFCPHWLIHGHSLHHRFCLFGFRLQSKKENWFARSEKCRIDSVVGWETNETQLLMLFFLFRRGWIQGVFKRGCFQYKQQFKSWLLSNLSGGTFKRRFFASVSGGRSESLLTEGKFLTKGKPDRM